MKGTFSKGSFLVGEDGSRGGGETKEVALLSITTAPTGSFAVGSKYYNLTDKKIYTAVVADSWDGATVDDPQFGVYYIYDNSTYVWDGDSLEKYNLEDKQDKTDNNLETEAKTVVGAINELNTEVDTKNPILEVDNTINENSYNVASNKAIAEGIKANTTNVVDDIVDVLPTADTLDKKVLLTTDNKIYKSVKEKEINSAFTVNGNLSIDGAGIITGFSDVNFISINSQFWVQFFPIKLRVVFDMMSSVAVRFLQLFRNDNNSLLFSLTVHSGLATNDNKFIAEVYDSNGDVIETQSCSFAEGFGNSVFDIKFINRNTLTIYREGTFIANLFLEKLNESLISAYTAAMLKLSNRLVGGASRGIANIDGINSSICSGSFIKQKNKLAIDTSVSNYVWQEYLTCQKGSKIINQQKGNLCYYDGTQWQAITGYPEEITDLVSTSKTFDSSNKLKVNADYNFGDLTSLTFDTLSIDSSPLGTTIKFNSGSTATAITDNSGIDWVDGSAPVPSANKTCLILIVNKMGFYKEW